MWRIQRLEGLDAPPCPHRYFDIIAGTGTGALQACMLGKLRMSTEEAIESYSNLVKDVFSDKKWFRSSRSGAFKSTKLREGVMDMVQRKTKDRHERMVDHQNVHNHCKTMVFAMSKHNMNASTPTIFRSYRAYSNPAPDCELWEAICASMAHPDLFKSVDIGEPPLAQSFLDGGIGCNNPLTQVLAEVRTIYPNRHIASVVSLGTGHTRTIQIPETGGLHWILPTNAILAIKDIAADSERVAQEMALRFQGTSNVYFRFNVDRGMQEVKLSEWERLAEVVAHTRAYTTQVDINQGLECAAEAVKERRPTLPGDRLDGQIHSEAKEKASSRFCPMPTSYFTGREDNIQKVKRCIVTENTARERRICVITGLGGAGKTQLALKVLEETREVWAEVVYVDASSHHTITAELGAFALARGVGTTPNDTIQWLASTQVPWLLVFDNADSPSLKLYNFFPQCDHGSIIITTRLRNMGALAQGPDSECHISEMDPQDALKLLMKRARIQCDYLSDEEKHAAITLLQEFGHLALAITHAGAYIYSRQVDVVTYKNLFHHKRQDILDASGAVALEVDSYQKMVYTTWKMCYDLLGSETQSIARPMLWIIAFLHHDSIQETMFERALANLLSYKPWLPVATKLEVEAQDFLKAFLSRFADPEGRWNQFTYLETMAELASASLIEYDRVNKVHTMHVLVQDWARTVLPCSLKAGLERSTALVAFSIDYSTTLEGYIFRRLLFPHVNKVVSEHEEWMIPILHCTHRLAWVYAERGKWKEAARLLIQSCHLSEKYLGCEHRGTLCHISELSRMYQNQGLSTEAEMLRVQVLDMQKRVMGEDHPDTLMTMANLANTYSSQGKWEKAEALLLRVLELRKQVLGEEHRDTLIDMSNLASIHRKQGKWAKAEAMEAHVIEVQKKLFGEEHPDTLKSMTGLACAYVHRGKLTQAEALLDQVFSGQKRILGEEHPETLETMANIATTRLKQGRLAEAEVLAASVTELHKRVMGQEHPATLLSMSELATIYGGQKKWARAEALWSEVLEIRKRVDGKNHPHTLLNMRSLGKIYGYQGRWEEAIRLLADAVHEYKRVLGDDHPDTRDALKDLSVAQLLSATPLRGILVVSGLQL